MWMNCEAKTQIRCAIYTRKSSEEGLEQSFNSLDAQREASRAFIGSQKHEGWRVLNTLYDDGGYSGATMDRPALRRLIEDVQAGRIDAVVVYKVDRLTRSLADFSKIIEIFDAHKVSFVSVTQQFNTTSSMGRLTLNVLLSFAQFEREVTGERIRDKIAASKRKGMWMGGTVPLGYDVQNRKLVVNATEAKRVRDIYRQYLELGCVSKLKIYLERTGTRSKERTSQTGHPSGGAAYSRGALYNILQNRLYRGEVAHRGQVYPGEQEAIVPHGLWERVQTQLRANHNAHQNGLRAAMPSLLVGLVYDQHGNRFTPAHAVKNGKRYRYYVSQAAIKNPGSSHRGPVRIPAGEIESLVCSKLRSFLCSPDALVDALASPGRNAAATQSILATAQEWSTRLTSGAAAETRAFIRNLISRIVVRAESIDLLLGKQALRSAFLGASHSSTSCRANSHNGLVRIKVNARLQRCGGEARFVLPANSAGEILVHPAQSLIKSVVRAHAWYRRVVRGQLTGCRSIAKATGLDERYVTRIFQCAFLAPDIVESILDGRQPPHMTLQNMRIRLPIDWAAQRQLLGFSPR
jgi:DNA invertase Pin-like site-specific DNA recombinase